MESNNKVNFRCTLCDEKCESKVNLSQHVRKIHHKDQVSQTQANPVKIEIELNSEYPCLYYGQTISSFEEKLEKHYGECREYGLVYYENNNKSSQPSPFLDQFNDLKYFYPPPFTLPTDAPCYTCSERFQNKIELRRHYDESHPDIILFWCDVCLTNFGSDRGLQSHMRNTLKDYF